MLQMKVSVAMITYNQEAFVAQAIDSVLMQNTDFDFELVIGDDCSTDKTRDIIIGYESKYGDRIRVLPPTKNLGINRNLQKTLLGCRGPYIALLEGDDYWTSPIKLQKQVNFLDTHPDCTICFHNALAFYENSRHAWEYCPPEQPPISTLNDILRVNFIPTCSVMFRGIAFDQLPNWFSELAIGDWPLHVFHAERGDIGYLTELMAAYRLHPGGAYSMQSPIYQQEQVTRMYQHLNRHLNFRYDSLIKDKIFDCWYALGVAHAKNGNSLDAKVYANYCLRAKPYGRHLFRRIKIIVRIMTPRLFRLSSVLRLAVRQPLDLFRQSR